ncbi:Endonuclease domain-containing 1 protein, partial [Ophiophagus hannah]
RVVGDDQAGFAECDAFFYGKVPPSGFPGEQVAKICQKYRGEPRFATLYSTREKIPLFAAFRYTEGDPAGQEEESRWLVEPQVMRGSGRDVGRRAREERLVGESTKRCVCVCVCACVQVCADVPAVGGPTRVCKRRCAGASLQRALAPNAVLDKIAIALRLIYRFVVLCSPSLSSFNRISLLAPTIWVLVFNEEQSQAAILYSNPSATTVSSDDGLMGVGGFVGMRRRKRGLHLVRKRSL